MKQSMRVSVVVVFLSMLLVATTAVAQPAATVITLGDSITLGQRAGVTWSQTYPSQLGAMVSWTSVANRGISGENTDGAILRIDRVLGEATPVRVVLVMYGMNDAAMMDDAACLMPRTEPRVPLTRFTTNLETLVDKIVAAGAIPVILTPTPMDETYPCSGVAPYGADVNYMLRQFAQAARDVATSKNALMVDLFAKYETSMPTLDGVHPNAVGLASVAETIAVDVFLRKKVLIPIIP